MSVVTFEMVVFSCALILLVKLRKNVFSSVGIVAGLTAYVPPNDKDFEVLEKTDAKPKTNMKGEPRKNDKQKAKTKAQFPMRTIPVNDGLLSYVQEFFETYDFLMLMFLASLIQFFVVASMSIIPYEPIQNLITINITFYVLTFLLVAVLCCLVKDSFNLGCWNLSDQTKMQLFMGAKAFVLIFGLFSSVTSKEILDVDLEKSHEELNERVNQALAPFGVSAMQVPIEATIVLFAMLGATISFCIVNQQVKFAHFFYEFSESEDLLDTNVQEGDDAETRSSKRMQKILSAFVYTNFLSPIFLILLYINPVIKQLLVPDLLTDQSYSLLKYAITFGVCLFRCTTFREEVQFAFNESYSLIQKLVQNKNEKLFSYVKYRIKENFLKTWYIVFSQTANIMIPTLMLLLKLLREVQIFKNKAGADSSVLEATQIKKHFKFTKLEAGQASKDIPEDLSRFDMFHMNNREILQEVVKEISNKGFVPHSYYRDVLEFVLFWYFFASFLTTSFALLYYRKFRSF